MTVERARDPQNHPCWKVTFELWPGGAPCWVLLAPETPDEAVVPAARQKLKENLAALTKAMGA